MNSPNDPSSGGGEPGPASGRGFAPPPELIQEHVGRILESPPFSRSERMKRFLGFTVGEVLAGRGEELKEYTIAVNVFDKPQDFDPHFDPIVRVEAGRLRSKLREYYETDGRSDSIRVTVRKRSYTPEFSWSAPEVRSGAAESAAKPGGTAQPDLTAVAVLPFVDLSSGGDQGHLCDGLTEEVLNTLSRVETLRVTARTSTMQYKDAAADVREIGLRLNAGSVLEGSVGCVGDRIRVTAQLVSVVDGYQLWPEIYDRSADDILSARSEIASSIARALRELLAGARKAPAVSGVPAKEPGGSGAYERCLEGRYWWSRRKVDDLFRAVACFEDAAARDPRDSNAYAGLAAVHALLAWRCIEPAAGHWDAAEEMAHHALELDGRAGVAWAALGFANAAHGWLWDEAEQAFQRGIELAPGEPTLQHWYAVYCLAPQRRLHEALHHARRAEQLDPLSAIIAAHTGLILYFRREYDAAIEQFRKALRLDPALHLAHFYTGMAEEQRCNFDAALTAYRASAALDPRDPSPAAMMVRCSIRAGRAGEAAGPAGRERFSPADLASIALAKGDHDAALAHLAAGCDMRCARIINLRVDPAFDQLKPDPRLPPILARIGLDR